MLIENYYRIAERMNEFLIDEFDTVETAADASRIILTGKGPMRTGHERPETEGSIRDLLRVISRHRFQNWDEVYYRLFLLNRATIVFRFFQTGVISTGE